MIRVIKLLILFCCFFYFCKRILLHCCRLFVGFARQIRLNSLLRRSCGTLIFKFMKSCLRSIDFFLIIPLNNVIKKGIRRCFRSWRAIYYTGIRTEIVRLIWPLPLLVVVRKCKIITSFIGVYLVSSARHIFTLPLGDLLHRHVVVLYVLLGVNARITIRVSRITLRLINRVIESCSQSSIIRITLTTRRQVVLSLSVFPDAWYTFFFRLCPVAQMHVLLKLHELLHLGFAFDCGDMLTKSDLQMLHI